MSQIRRFCYILSALILAALITSMTWKPPAPPRFHAIDAGSVPMAIGDFKGADVTLDQATLDALASAQVITREYMAPDGSQVSLALIGGSDRAALHDPRSCIVGAGGRIDNDRLITLLGTGMAVRECDAVGPAAGGTGQQTSADTIYFYMTREGVVANATEIRARLLLSAFELRDEPVVFVRFMAPYPSDNAPARDFAHRRLMSFAEQMWQRTGSVIKEAVQ